MHLRFCGCEFSCGCDAVVIVRSIANLYFCNIVCSPVVIIGSLVPSTNFFYILILTPTKIAYFVFTLKKSDNHPILLPESPGKFSFALK